MTQLHFFEQFFERCRCPSSFTAGTSGLKFWRHIWDQLSSRRTWWNISIWTQNCKNPTQIDFKYILLICLICDISWYFVVKQKHRGNFQVSTTPTSLNSNFAHQEHLLNSIKRMALWFFPESFYKMHRLPQSCLLILTHQPETPEYEHAMACHYRLHLSRSEFNFHQQNWFAQVEPKNKSAKHQYCRGKWPQKILLLKTNPCWCQRNLLSATDQSSTEPTST